MRKRWLLVPLFLLLIYGVVRCAWLADDAYITFRASDNLIHGYGPRWNTFERVQAFTTPLWMLVVAFVIAITGELIKTVAALQIGLTLATAFLIARHARTQMSAAVALGVLCVSRAFVDFSSAGMENPLAHLLVVWFGIETLRGGRVFVRSILASLLLVTRLDFFWLVVPTMLDLVIRAPWSLRKKALIGMTPILLWEGFAFFYFGSFLPNSARAKLGTGIPLTRLANQGAEYFFDSLRIDPLTLVAILVAIVLAGFGARRARPLALGLLLTLGYVLLVGGDFMSGRFFTVPLALAAVLLADMRAFCTRRAAAVGGAGILGLSGLAGFPTLTDGFQRIPNIELTVVDCRLAFHPFTGLTVGMLPAYIEYGKKLRTTPGVTVQPGIGIAGYYAGPTVKILDAFALADPLRSRFPIPDPRNESFLKMGHLMRPIPDGYVETMQDGGNALADPRLRAYWDVIAKVTQGPLFDADRIATSLKLELGLYDDLLDDYFSTYDEKPILARDLVHPPGLDPKCYTWWRPCADEGIAFTESGLRIDIGIQIRPSRIVFDATSDDYMVVFRLGGKEQRRAFAPREQQIVEVDDTIDAIVFLPRTGPGVRTLKTILALP
jgi:arabinofuranosyltransferase